jgi:uncharacterized protein (TIGR02118 family)
MHRLSVLYGHPADPAAFDRYYHDVHIAIAKKMRGFSGWTIGKCQTAVEGELPPYYLIVGLYAESREKIDQILATPEGQAAIADVPKFATGGYKFMFNEETVLIPVKLE